MNNVSQYLRNIDNTKSVIYVAPSIVNIAKLRIRNKKERNCLLTIWLNLGGVENIEIDKNGIAPLTHFVYDLDVVLRPGDSISALAVTLDHKEKPELTCRITPNE